MQLYAVIAANDRNEHQRTKGSAAALSCNSLGLSASHNGKSLSM